MLYHLVGKNHEHRETENHQQHEPRRGERDQGVHREERLRGPGRRELRVNVRSVMHPFVYICVLLDCSILAACSAFFFPIATP